MLVFRFHSNLSLSNWSLLGNTALRIYTQILPYLVSIIWVLFCMLLKKPQSRISSGSASHAFQQCQSNRASSFSPAVRRSQRCSDFLVYKIGISPGGVLLQQCASKQRRVFSTSISCYRSNRHSDRSISLSLFTYLPIYLLINLHPWKGTSTNLKELRLEVFFFLIFIQLSVVINK